MQQLPRPDILLLPAGAAPHLENEEGLEQDIHIDAKDVHGILHPKERSRDYLLYRHGRTEADPQTGALPDRPLVYKGNIIIGRISEGDLPQ